MYSVITSGRVFDGELFYTKIQKVNLFAFAYELFHGDFFPINGAYPIHVYSGITSGRVFDGELLYTKIQEVNLFAFAYRLFHRDFSPINGALPLWKLIYLHLSSDCFIKISLHSSGLTIS